jgi:hypothetical protein
MHPPERQGPSTVGPNLSPPHRAEQESDAERHGERGVRPRLERLVDGVDHLVAYLLRGPLAPTSDTTPSTFAFARLQATLPLAEKISAICVASRVTSSRSACRSAWISSLAADAALPLSRAASLTSRVVTRTVSRTVSLIVPDVLDMAVLHSQPKIFLAPPTARKGKSSAAAPLTRSSVRQFTLIRRE